MKTKNNNQTKSTLAALAGLALAAGSAHAATIIPIVNGDFAADNGGDWTVVPSWNEGANSWTYTPAGNQLLYLNQGGKVDQDLSHNWTSGDTFTLSLTGQDPNWGGVGEAFSVQLRQTDGTVLWDSGSIVVDGLIAGQVFSWLSIDASTFAGVDVLENSQLNIQIQGAAGGSVFVDDVSLSFDTVPEPTTTALLGLGGLALILRRRK
jgi:hypothetical protein